METRALAIAFFYAIGTAAGGITGPLLFAHLVGSGKVGDTVLAFCIGAVLMILAGLVELVLGVRAERKSLEDLATPLSGRRPAALTTVCTVRVGTAPLIGGSRHGGPRMKQHPPRELGRAT